jgi:hypothetical protein
MNRIQIAVALLATIQLISAQEKLAREEALTYAKIVSADAKQLNGTPIPTDVDAQEPVAVKEENYGGMVLPQKNLKAETIAQAGETPLPIGQLWLHKLTLVRDGSGIPGDKLRLATVKHNGEDITVPQCALGVRRNDSGALELLVFGKDKVPLLKVPLKKIEAQQEPPIDLSAERTGDEGSVTLKILGKYEAKLRVTELEL